MDKQYTSLGKLVGDKFTVKSVGAYKFKMWDTATKHMVIHDTPHEGFSKKWQVETDKGTLDLGTGQLGNLLESVMKDGVADINGRTFEVRSNGKEKLEVRYFLNPVKDFEPEPTVTTSEPMPEDIPF